MTGGMKSCYRQITVTCNFPVCRYITWPGQALGYKIGEIRLRELRARAEEKMAGKFKLADFHDVVLKTAGPLDVLEEEVDKYIATATE